ncbi:MAG: copper ion binding protein [Helicobacteraceae bacterium]|nr:copper ion binding protein [Helicobacteraceae bacterium]
MEKAVFEVSGMRCDHCVQAVKRAVGDLVQSLSVDLDKKTVTVEYDPTNVKPEAIKEAIEEQGYDVA